ncbi:MAG TPA: DUF1579 family protein [Candidatus Kapabacteria bacterium]|nr:DUF1579 family protein [Candidatus Kapabacteria bacterium]
MHAIRCILIALVTMGVVTAARAQSPMEEMMKKAQPGPQHELLKEIAGTWNYRLTDYMSGTPQTSNGTATSAMILGGRFLKVETFGTMMGMSANTFSMMGFDNRNGKYFMWEVDEMGTYSVFAEGTYDAASRKLTLRGENEEEGQKVPFRFTYTMIDKDHFTFEIAFSLGSAGKPMEQKVLEIAYTRAS